MKEQDPDIPVGSIVPESESPPEASAVPVSSGTSAPAATGGPAEDPAADDAVEGGNRFLVFQAIPSWMFSVVIHTVILVVLGLIMIPFEADEIRSLTSVMTKNDLIEEIVEDLTDPLDEPVDIEPEDLEVEVQVDTIEEVTDVEEVEISDDVEAPVAAVEFEQIADQVAPTTDLLSTTETVVGSGLSGRGTKEARSQMVREYGGNNMSEAAVAMALKWIANHQNQNGSWSFDHALDGRRCNCTKPGSMASSFNGATAMALLPFLGAGNTHKTGQYKKHKPPNSIPVQPLHFRMLSPEPSQDPEYSRK